MSLKVTGHSPADTDSVCSPLVYAWYLSTVMTKPATAVANGKLNRETEFVLEHFGVTAPESIESFAAGDQVVLIDSTNPEEMTAGFADAEVVEIIDHHKLAGITTTSPVPVTIKPYGCVATVIAEKIDQESSLDKLEPQMAGLLLAAVISDTLKFTSSTTTATDREYAQKLAKLSGEDVEALAAGMFAAKSDLTGMSISDILNSDAKTFEFGGKKYRLAVLETTLPANALAMQAELVAEMTAAKQRDGYDGFFFFVVDILKTESTLVLPSATEEGIAVKAFGGTVENGQMHLPGLVSRKKEFAPKIEGVVG